MNNRLLGTTEISEYLGIKMNTIYAWVNQRRIPYIKVGRLVKFDIRKIEEWVSENTVEVREW